MADDVTPEPPAAEGIDPDYPDETRQEGVHLLVNQARDRLKGQGFTDEQIFEWATAFSQQVGGGSVDGLVDYIRAQQSRG